VVLLFLLPSCEGPTGLGGLTSLINIVDESIGTNCAFGGIKIDWGLDDNRNGILDEDEVKTSNYVCSVAGKTSLVNAGGESPGENCEFGGIKVNTGIDINSDGTLEENEITSTDYVCNVAGKTSLINISDEEPGSNCQNAGVRIDSGIDNDEDGLLDQDEIQISRFLCNGVDGSVDEEIRLLIAAFPNNYSINNGGNTTGSFVGSLIAFDRTHWSDIDSIKFLARIRTEDQSSKAIAVLHDLSNLKDIVNSSIETNSTSSNYLYSANILQELPDSQIDIAIKLKSELGGIESRIGDGSAFLILYRNN
jgi:hypothetical protein